MYLRTALAVSIILALVWHYGERSITNPFARVNYALERVLNGR
jgi:hypothetical protein